MYFKPTISKFLSVIAVTGLLAVTLNSCQKSSVEANPSRNNQQNLNVTNDAIQASGGDEENFDMVMGNGEYADQDASGSASNAVANKLSGKTVSYSPSKDVYPHTMTIDFGSGWTNKAGVLKAGKVIITYYAPAGFTGGEYSYTTYDGYFSGGVKIEGSVRLDIINVFGKTAYVHTINKKLSDATGSVKTFVGAATWTLTDFQGGTNNAYKITEYTVGSEVFNGTQTSAFITRADDDNPIIKPLTYSKRVQGVLIANIHICNAAPGQPSDLEEHLDYGNGTLDNAATLSINDGAAQPVTLPLSFWPLNL